VESERQRRFDPLFEAFIFRVFGASILYLNREFPRRNVWHRHSKTQKVHPDTGWTFEVIGKGVRLKYKAEAKADLTW